MHIIDGSFRHERITRATSSTRVKRNNVLTLGCVTRVQLYWIGRRSEIEFMCDVDRSGGPNPV